MADLADQIEAAIAAAVSAEREACAKVCAEIGATYDHVIGIGTHGNELIEIRSVSSLIRARSAEDGGK
jgi:predicted transcriptional regulator